MSTEVNDFVGYVPIPSVGHEIGIIFGFGGLMFICMVVYLIMWKSTYLLIVCPNSMVEIESCHAVQELESFIPMPIRFGTDPYFNTGYQKKIAKIEDERRANLAATDLYNDQKYDAKGNFRGQSEMVEEVK